MSSFSPSSAAAGDSAAPVVARYVVHRHVFVVRAQPAQVFPLLCPVREYDWIPTWQAEMIHTVSGVAELGCIFRTALPEGECMTWVVTVYEPPRRIEFTCFVPDHCVMRLSIDAAAVAEGTQLTWTRGWFAMDPAGDAMVEAWSNEALDAKMASLARLLVHYLATGTMLRS
jgi:hypothetical protein